MTCESPGHDSGQRYSRQGSLTGATTSPGLIPPARLLPRNSIEPSRLTVFVAEFSLVQACFLLTYPLAGAFRAAIGLPVVGLLSGDSRDRRRVSRIMLADASTLNIL